MIKRSTNFQNYICKSKILSKKNRPNINIIITELIDLIKYLIFADITSDSGCIQIRLKIIWIHNTDFRTIIIDGKLNFEFQETVDATKKGYL